MYAAMKVDETYYYISDYAADVSVSGNKITAEYDGDTDTATYKIEGGKLTLASVDEDGEENSEVYTKVSATPKPITENELDELFSDEE